MYFRRIALKHPLLSILLLLELAGVGGCVASYRLEKPFFHRQDSEDALRLRWYRDLVPREILSYKPQEWASAAFSDTALFIGTSAGQFLAIERRTGNTLWSLPVGGAIASSPLYVPSMDMIFVGANNGYLYAVSARSGHIKWKYKTNGTIQPRPSLSEGLLFFTTSEGRLYALDALSGAWRWQYERDIPDGFTIHGYAGAVATPNAVFSGFADGTLVALKPFSGDVIWSRSLAHGKSRFVDIDSTPVMRNGILYAASHASGVYALQSDTGTIVWQYPIDGASGIVVSDHDDMIYFSSPKAGLVALGAMGRLQYRQAISGSGVFGAPVLNGRSIFVTGTESGLASVNATSGELLQYFNPGHGMSAVPTVHKTSLAVLSNQGRLYYFDILASNETLSTLWSAYSR